MSESMEDKIARLKREYRMAEQALEFRKLLGQKRDELEKSIEDLKKEVEAEKFKVFKNKNGTIEDSNKANEKFQQNSELLNSVKGTQRELDAKLDEYELYSTEMLFSLREELILTILDLHPVKKSEFESLQKRVQSNLILLERITTIEQANNRVLEQLRIIAAERRSVKKQNLLRYLFGTNPNIAITNCLMTIENTISDTLPIIENTLQIVTGTKNREALLKKSSQIFTTLQEHARSRWGWKKLDHDIIPYQEQLDDLKKQFQEIIGDIESEIQDLRLEVDAWIERNSH
jgi:hypothetical protein